MSTYHKSTLKNIERLTAAAKNPILSERGQVRVVATLEHYHIAKSTANGRKLKSMLSPKFSCVKIGGGRLSSMKIAEKAMKKGWEKVVQHPAIYSITCLGSGKSYIGSSMRPDLRRAVHLYWLKNYWRWGTSNIFFGNTAIARDVDKYGAENFQLDIIASYPNISSDELRVKEREYLQKHGITKFYNRHDGGKYSDGGYGFAFIEVDQVIKEMREDLFATQDKLDNLTALQPTFWKELEAMRKASYAKYKQDKDNDRAKKAAGIKLTQQEQLLTTYQYQIREAEISKKRLERAEEIRRLKMECFYKGQKIRDRIKELKEYYGNLTEKPSVTSVK